MRSLLGLTARSEALALAALLMGCSGGGEKAPAGEPKKSTTVITSRGDSVPEQPASAATAAVPAGNTTGAAGFCEKLYAPGEKPFTPPAERPISGAKAAPPAAGWTWVNLWATWCKPCVEEMDLFGRWKENLQREGKPINVELWSIDAEADEGALKARIEKGLPGNARWVASDAAFQTFLESIGVEKGAAIPIHVLVDPKNNTRCVRVGSIRPEDYALVKGLLQGG